MKVLTVYAHPGPAPVLPRRDSKQFSAGLWVGPPMAAARKIEVIR
jgi:hypothetical protein